MLARTVAGSFAAVACAGAVAGSVLAAPGDPKLEIKRSDQAYARTILLKRGEVPGSGWRAQPTDFGQPNPPCLVRHYSLSRLTATAQAGVVYTRVANVGAFLVESDAHLFTTPGQADTASAIASNLGFGRCLTSALVTQAPKGSIATSSVRRLAIGGLAIQAHGFRITLRAVQTEPAFNLTALVLVMKKGRTLSVLSVLAHGTGWSNATLRSVVAPIARRTAGR